MLFNIHIIVTTWPFDGLFFTVRKYAFFRRILVLSRPIFQKNFIFQKFGHRTVLFLSDEMMIKKLCNLSNKKT